MCTNLHFPSGCDRFGFSAFSDLHSRLIFREIERFDDLPLAVQRENQLAFMLEWLPGPGFELFALGLETRELQGKLMHDPSPEELLDLLPVGGCKPKVNGHRQRYGRSIGASATKPLAEIREALC